MKYLKKSLSSKLSLFLVIMVLCIECIAPIKAKANEPEARKDKTGKKIVAYYPEWGIYEQNDYYSVENIPWNKVTHINYAFGIIKEGQIAIDNKLAATGTRFTKLRNIACKGNFCKIKKMKKKYPNVKVSISIGGWAQSAGFHDVAATAESRRIFSDSVVKFIRKWGFDGVDIDWEYPGFKREPDKVADPKDTGTPRANMTEKQTFTLLLKDLRAALDKAGKEDGKHYLLTAAVGSGKDKIERTEPDKYPQYLDFINVMTYDMTGAWNKVTGHQSPLYKNPKDNRDEISRNYYNVEAAMKIFESYGIPKDKLLVGAPYYSRGWKNVKKDGPIPELPGLFASADGGAKGIWDGGRPEGVNPFYYMKGVLEKDSSYKKYRDTYSKVPYLYSEAKGVMYTYEDEESIKEKVNYVNKNGYGGILIWEVTGDYPSKGGTTLTDIIYNGFYGK